MIKKLQKLHSKKGFTLTELIIVIGILAVLMAAVAAISGPVQDMVRKTATSSDAMNVNAIIGDYIEGRLSFASQASVIYGVDASKPAGKLNTRANATASWITKEEAGKGGTAGALVFRYVPNADEPEKSSYILYDVALPSGTTAYPGIADKDKVYDDDFYCDTQRMIVVPKAGNETKKVKNPDTGVEEDVTVTYVTQDGKVRSVTYMTLDIHSYRGDPGYVSDNRYIKADTLNKVYADEDAKKTDTLDALTAIQSGPVEAVTFRMSNMKSSVTIESDPTAIAGSDVVIFYYIPKFDSYMPATE